MSHSQNPPVKMHQFLDFANFGLINGKHNSLLLLWTQLTGWSGVFATLRAAASKNIGETMRSFSAGTWNARSFFCRDQTLFGKKLKYLHKQIKLFDVFCMQEVRGSEALVNKHLRLIMRTHWIFCNFSSGRINTGGLLTFVSKNSAPNEASVSHLSLVDGRASRILISSIDSTGPKGPLGTETGPKSTELEPTLNKKGSDFGANLEPKPTHLDIVFLSSLQSHDKEAFGSQNCKKEAVSENTGAQRSPKSHQSGAQNGFFGGQVSTTDPRPPVVEKRDSFFQSRSQKGPILQIFDGF